MCGSGRIRAMGILMERRDRERVSGGVLGLSERRCRGEAMVLVVMGQSAFQEPQILGVVWTGPGLGFP